MSKEIPKSAKVVVIGGGVEIDLSVICIDKNHFRIISSAATRTHDKVHILKHLLTNVIG